VLNVLTIKAMLRGFELVLGLQINFNKRKFGTFGVSVAWVQNSATILNCMLFVFLFVYLGLPIEANPRRAETWESIVVKFQRKLSKWRQRHLSFGGRVCLIKSVLNSILIFYFSFFKIPKVIEILVRLQRRFLWDERVDEIKTAWVKWETVCLLKSHGDLQVRDLELFNRALLGKWKWSLLQEDDSL